MKASDLPSLKRWYLGIHRHVARTGPRYYAPRLGERDARWLSAWYVRWLHRSHSFVLLVEVGETPVGFLAAGLADAPDRHTRLEERPNLQGHIHDVFVEPQTRRIGAATALFEAAERRFRAVGCDNLRLGVAAGNASARRLYKRLGFEEHKLGLRKDLRSSSLDWEEVRRRRTRAIRKGPTACAVPC